MCTADILPQQVPSDKEGGGLVFDFLVNSIYTESSTEVRVRLVTALFLLLHRTTFLVLKLLL